MTMTHRQRLRVIMGLLLLTTAYGLTIVVSPDLALNAMVFYCGVILTVFAIDAWSNRHGRR